MAKIIRLEESVATLVTTRELLERGVPRTKIDRLLRQNKLVRIRQGVFLDPPVDLKYEESRHKLRAVGFAMASRRNWSLSHWSAALMHGLPSWQLPLTRTSVTVDSGTPRSKRTSTSYQRSTALPSEEIVIISGVAVTEIRRTLFDIATTCSFAASVVAIECALFRRMVSKHELVAYFRSKRNRNSLPIALKALALASSRSESVLESRSRLFFEHFGLPQPEQQVEIITRSGRRYRVDFLWRGLKLIGEADGKAKILDGPETEQSKRLRNHWQREEDLRAEGYTVVRWGWEDLSRPYELKARIENAFGQAQRLAA